MPGRERAVAVMFVGFFGTPVNVRVTVEVTSTGAFTTGGMDLAAAFGRLELNGHTAVRGLSSCSSQR